MGNHDLRSYLSSLEEKNQLLRIKEEVDTLDEMGAFIARADNERVDKALLFENPKGFDIPVLANTIGSTTTRIASTFGVSAQGAVPQIAQKMGQILKTGGVAPKSVEKDEAPCKEIILKGDEVDISKLPILRLNPEDGTGTENMTEGRFIPSLACSKPAPNAHNLSYHRLEVQGPRHGPVWVFRMTGDAKSISEAWGYAY